LKVIPLTVVDNFFDNPDAVRKWALSLDYEQQGQNRWPGLRTEYLHEIDENFFSQTCQKVLSLFVSEDLLSKSVHYITRMHFQLIPANKYTGGWVHIDGKEVLTAIVYLSPNGGLDNGTSLYKLKNNLVSFDSKHNLKKNYNSLGSEEEAEEARMKNNDQFVETARVGGIYNRLMVFDATEYHSVEDYNLGNDEDRLTLIMFFEKVNFVDLTPIARMKRAAGETL